MDARPGEWHHMLTAAAQLFEEVERSHETQEPPNKRSALSGLTPWLATASTLALISGQRNVTASAILQPKKSGIGRTAGSAATPRLRENARSLVFDRACYSQRVVQRLLRSNVFNDRENRPADDLFDSEPVQHARHVGRCVARELSFVRQISCTVVRSL
jgi:hypothetical protein